MEYWRNGVVEYWHNCAKSYAVVKTACCLQHTPEKLACFTYLKSPLSPLYKGEDPR